MALPQFQSPARPYLYLPEYVQVMTMLLSMYRDGVVDGPSFGLDAASMTDFEADLKQAITAGDAYVTDQIAAFNTSVSTSTDPTYSNVDNFDAVQTLDDGLIPVTSDLSFYWKYMDPIAYPPSVPIDPKNTRVLYTPSFGYVDKNGPIQLDKAGAGAGVDPITHLEMWGNSRLDALSVTYGTNPASKLGGNGGDRTPPHGIGMSFLPLANQHGPITEVTGYYDPHAVPITLDFHWQASPAFPAGSSGDLGWQLGPDTPYSDVNLHYQPFDVVFPGEILGYAKVLGVSSGYDSANTVVFGFRFPDSYPSPVT